MSTYSKKKLLNARPIQIQQMADAISSEFTMDGFEVYIDSLISGGCDLSITKGNMFKAVLGMKSALKVSLIPQPNGVLFEANVGIFGQQAIPTFISMLFFWPVLITQIWGLIEQSKLDDKALSVAEKTITQKTEAFSLQEDIVYCTNCGAIVDKYARFCSSCGNMINPS